MRNCVIAISSVNHALRAEKFLAQKGFAVRIIKLQPDFTKKGCAYGLEIGCKHLAAALSLLEGAGITYSEVVR